MINVLQNNNLFKTISLLFEQTQPWVGQVGRVLIIDTICVSC